MTVGDQISEIREMCAATRVRIERMPEDIAQAAELASRRVIDDHVARYHGRDSRPPRGGFFSLSIDPKAVVSAIIAALLAAAGVGAAIKF